VKTHSDITVAVARKTKAGCSMVTSAIAVASVRSTPTIRTAYRRVSSPTPSIAAIDTVLSSHTLPGKPGATRNTHDRTQGNAGG